MCYIHEGYKVTFWIQTRKVFENLSCLDCQSKLWRSSKTSSWKCYFM